MWGCPVRRRRTAHNDIKEHWRKKREIFCVWDVGKVCLDREKHRLQGRYRNEWQEFYSAANTESKLDFDHEKSRGVYGGKKKSQNQLKLSNSEGVPGPCWRSHGKEDKSGGGKFHGCKESAYHITWGQKWIKVGNGESAAKVGLW